MTQAPLSIGHLARETGCKVQTIRYYEDIGLMPAPLRSAGNQRRYGPAHVARLAFIRHSRELGFSLDAIRELLSLADDPDQPCDAADRIARAQLAAVETRLARLQALKLELERMVACCQGGRIAECRVIEVLADHNECLHKDHTAPIREGSVDTPPSDAPR
ncbi:MAG: MerR family transcriptional regulator [Alphaproteobacteria bacterium]|nr:MAG: MerR family transcriptional regulator [Alphaproteobacteria bacterium]